MEMMQMKKIRYLIFLLIIYFTLTISASANSISKISMDIYVDNFGDAKITEIWNANLSEGTELLRSYDNLNASVIT